MKLHCPNCAAKISSNHINMSRLIAKCEVCDHLFPFDDMLTAVSKPNSREPMAVPQPPKVTVNHKFGQLALQWNWIDFQLFFLTFFAIVWNGFMFSMLVSAFSALREEGVLVFLPVLILPHTWVGLGLIYYVLAGYLNKTEVVLNDIELKINHTPIPWLGNHTISRHDIAQLYVKAVRGNKGRISYQLHAISTHGKQQKFSLD